MNLDHKRKLKVAKNYLYGNVFLNQSQSFFHWNNGLTYQQNVFTLRNSINYYSRNISEPDIYLPLHVASLFFESIASYCGKFYNDLKAEDELKFMDVFIDSELPKSEIHIKGEVVYSILFVYGY